MQAKGLRDFTGGYAWTAHKTRKEKSAYAQRISGKKPQVSMTFHGARLWRVNFFSEDFVEVCCAWRQIFVAELNLTRDFDRNTISKR